MGTYDLVAAVCDRRCLRSRTANNTKSPGVTDHRYIADERIGEGDGGRVVGSLRTLVTRGIDLGAKGVVLAHNHPSGCAKPSTEDVEATRKVARSLADLDFVLADHVIVGGMMVTSMRGAGLL